MLAAEFELHRGRNVQRDGEQFLQYFIELGGLKPSDRVLDVGCGIGRLAIPLTQYLDARGGYAGLDIVLILPFVEQENSYRHGT